MSAEIEEEHDRIERNERERCLDSQIDRIVKNMPFNRASFRNRPIA